MRREPLVRDRPELEALREALGRARQDKRQVRQQSSAMDEELARGALEEGANEVHTALVGLIDVVWGDCSPEQYLRLAEVILKYVEGR